MKNQSYTRRTLSSLIKDVINESIKSDMYSTGVEERELQQRMTEEDDDILGDDEGGAKSSKTMSSEKEKLAKGEISSDDIIEKLNSIRAGRSFRDEDISSKLDEYVESLTKAEKVALLAYLKGLSQIVSGEFEGDDAMDPGDNPASVAMKKKGQQQKRTIKPTVIKRPEKDKGEEEKKKKPAEDTSGPVPIKPKK